MVWDLKAVAFKYCQQDCITFYQIIDKFRSKIFKQFKFDILKYHTLPSLAFVIFRANFLGEFKFPIFDGSLFYDIKKGYTGGSVDVYKPYGENIYRYEINLLFHYGMKNFPLPVGNPILFLWRYFNGRK